MGEVHLHRIELLKRATHTSNEAPWYSPEQLPQLPLALNQPRTRRAADGQHAYAIYFDGKGDFLANDRLGYAKIAIMWPASSPTQFSKFPTTSRDPTQKRLASRGGWN